MDFVVKKELSNSDLTYVNVLNPKKFKAVYAFAAFQYSIGSLLPPSALNAK